MSRLTKIALVLALPANVFGCAGDQDNETNASADDAGTSADDTGSTSNTSPTSTMPTSGPDDTADDSADTGPDDTGPPPGCVDGDSPDAPRLEVATPIEADTTLTCDTVWVLTEATFVNGATLTIEPGTTIVGASGSALVINTDSTINAAGTAAAPIVFTSAQPKGSRQRADWGGVVLLGLAEVNLPNGVGQAEGFADPPMYGGNDTAHNCGTLQYVRVEWAGFELVMDNELNGITFYACGTGTTVDHVQVHMGSDDGLEFFGGAFDVRHVVLTGNADDNLDIDLGFTGSVQHVFIHQDPGEADGNHGFEISNGPDDFSATPRTDPYIGNVTYVGQGDGGNPSKSIGFNIKEGGNAHIYNSCFTNVTGAGATFQDQATLDVAETGIVVEGSFWGTHAGFGSQGDGPYTWTDMMWGEFLLGQTGNMDALDLALDGTWTTPNAKPAAASAAVGGGVAPGGDLEPTTYVGAVNPDAADDWTQAGWINYAVD